MNIQAILATQILILLNTEYTSQINQQKETVETDDRYEGDSSFDIHKRPIKSGPLAYSTD